MEYFKTDFKSLVLAAEDVEKYVELECEKARAWSKVLQGFAWIWLTPKGREHLW